MYTVWTKKTKNAEEKEKLEKSLMNSKWILELQSEILTEMDKSLDRVETNPKTYDSPNWEYRQAHNNGYRQCLQLILKLNNLDQKDTNDPRQPTSG